MRNSFNPYAEYRPLMPQGPSIIRTGGTLLSKKQSANTLLSNRSIVKLSVPLTLLYKIRLFSVEFAYSLSIFFVAIFEETAKPQLYLAFAKAKTREAFRYAFSRNICSSSPASRFNEHRVQSRKEESRLSSAIKTSQYLTSPFGSKRIRATSSPSSSSMEMSTGAGTKTSLPFKYL